MNTLKNKYFKISSFRPHKYDLLITPLDLSKSLKISQSEADNVFTTKLQNWLKYEHLGMNEIPPFLEYHFKKFKGEPSEFIIHIKDILNRFRNQLSLYHVITRPVNDWLIEKENELPNKKERTAFEKVFNDQKKPEELITILRTHEVIDSKNTWIGLDNKKTTINILIDVLNQKGCIDFTNQTDMSTIFSDKFKIKSSPKTKRYFPTANSGEDSYDDQFENMLSSFKCTSKSI